MSTKGKKKSSSKNKNQLQKVLLATASIELLIKIIELIQSILD